MSISYFFSGLGKVIFSIKKIAKINTIIANNNFIKVLILNFLYLLSVVFKLHTLWFYLNSINKTYL